MARKVLVARWKDPDTGSTQPTLSTTATISRRFLQKVSDLNQDLESRGKNNLTKTKRGNSLAKNVKPPIQVTYDLETTV